MIKLDCRQLLEKERSLKPNLHDIPSQLVIDDVKLIRFFSFINEVFEVSFLNNIEDEIIGFPFVYAGGSFSAKAQVLTSLTKEENCFFVEKMDYYDPNVGWGHLIENRKFCKPNFDAYNLIDK